MASHESCPQAQHIGGDRYRIWCAPRDGANRSYCAWFEIDIKQPDEILALADDPVLGPGGLGAFDEQGAMFSWVMQVGIETRLYYTGWNIGETVRFRNAIGLARQREPGAPFERTGPVLDRSPTDPYFVGNPCVLIDQGIWHLWYLSGTRWRAGAPPTAEYNIRHATSADGIAWRPDARPAIDFEHKGEMAIARPSVSVSGGVFRMWYCYRGEDFPYRIGYAESAEGAHWNRMDESVVFVSSGEAWDREMIAYPHVFTHAGTQYMLYCGNGFSEAGIGLAVLQP
jgi:hypothetical protein